MSEDVRLLFRELAGLPTEVRANRYERQRVPAAVRDEIESLLDYDAGGGAITAVVRSATEDFLLSDAPVTGERRCGPYRLIRLLGNGGMGAVYLAERVDGELEQQVAIKVVRSGQDLPSFRARFLRERQILASLNHPGIARLLDAGRSAGHPYLVMEYVEGVRIDQYASRLDTREILELFLGVADAVSYAHRNLIIHRDLKPSNILVDAAGRPKLLDFGIAKLLDETEETQTAEWAMTPEYASPEQLRGDAQATSTDIYSLGAVLHRLLTGRSPRESANTARDLPRDLACILRKCMREEPDDRYGSVDLLIADVQAYLEHRPVQARRGNVFYHARKFLRRRWLPMAAGALAVLGVAGGLLVANRERAIAERRFDQVRQLSKQFLDLDAEIRALPGSTMARSRIVSSSMEYLGRLAAETGRSPWRGMGGRDMDLALELGGAYLKVARVQGVPVNSNLGQFQQARESLAKADSLVDPVVATSDRSRRRRALLTSAEIARDSMILAESVKQNAEALAFGRKAAQRLEALLAEPGFSPEEAVTAVGLYGNLGLALSNMHHLDEAARYARKSVEIARAAGRDERQLGRVLGILANTSRFSGDLEGALAAVREAHAIGEKSADPDNAESMLQLAAALWREALILGEPDNISLNRPQEAVPLLERGWEIAKTIAREDPADYSSRSYVSMTGRELARLLSDGNPARALAVFDETRRLLTENRNPKSRREEVMLWTGSSYALRRLGRAAEAGQRIHAALEILRELHEYPAAKVQVGGECDGALRALADHYADTGDTAAAIRAYEDLQGKLAASSPQPGVDLRHANSMSRLYRDLGRLYQRAGRRAEAEALRQRRLYLWQYWDHTLPGNVFVQRQLAEARQAG